MEGSNDTMIHNFYIFFGRGGYGKSVHFIREVYKMRAGGGGGQKGQKLLA